MKLGHLHKDHMGPKKAIVGAFFVIVNILRMLVASSDRYLFGLFCFTEEEGCGEKLRQCQIKAERDFYLSFLTSFVWQ